MVLTKSKKTTQNQNLKLNYWKGGAF